MCCGNIGLEILINAASLSLKVQLVESHSEVIKYWRSMFVRLKIWST